MQARMRRAVKHGLPVTRGGLHQYLFVVILSVAAWCGVGWQVCLS